MSIVNNDEVSTFRRKSYMAEKGSWEHYQQLQDISMGNLWMNILLYDEIRIYPEWSMQFLLNCLEQFLLWRPFFFFLLWAFKSEACFFFCLWISQTAVTESNIDSSPFPKIPLKHWDILSLIYKYFQSTQYLFKVKLVIFLKSVCKLLGHSYVSKRACLSISSKVLCANPYEIHFSFISVQKRKPST